MNDIEMGEVIVSESRLTEAQKLVEVIAQTHMAIAMSKDAAIADGRGSVYTASERLFKVAIMAAYPDLSEEQIYQVWVECNESIEFCAAHVKREADFEAAQLTHVHIQHDDTLREMIVPRRIFDEHYGYYGWGILGSMTADDAHHLRYTK